MWYIPVPFQYQSMFRFYKIDTVEKLLQYRNKNTILQKASEEVLESLLQNKNVRKTTNAYIA